MSDRIVRVASGQGFWGDSLDAPRQQVEGGEIDYLMLDYLAEVTMSILQKQKERDPAMGYARDFVGAMDSVLDAVTDRGVRVIANAGGVNPPACAAAVRDGARKRGKTLRIGVVTGDDLLPRLDELTGGGPCAREHGYRRAARLGTRSRALGERVHRLQADRRSAFPRRAGSDHWPLDRYRAHDGADQIRVRLEGR